MTAAPGRRAAALCLLLLPALAPPGAAWGQAPASTAQLIAPGFALDLPAAARLAVERDEGLGSTNLPTGPLQAEAVPMRRLEGQVQRRVWRIADPSLTTLDLLRPVREAARAAGYQILLDCAAVECGGFDFRYQVEILPEPAMHVDLGDFRYLSALRSGPEGEEGLTLTVSRDAHGSFVQLVTVAPMPSRAVATGGAPLPRPTPDPAPDQAPASPTPDPGPDPGAALLAAGHAVLSWLDFASGGSVLPDGPVPVLETLAGWLAAHPQARIALVGHTDASGPAAANLALSRARAEAVRRRLAALGVAPERMRAEGVGSLAPRATNRTPEGRAANRRVEAVLDAGP